MTNKRIRLGNIYAIPLPDGRFAFGRRLKDACIAIYKHLGESVENVPEEGDYLFVVGVYDSVLKSGRWPVVAYRAFKSEDEAWPPPMYVLDKLSGKYSIYHHGVLRECSPEECTGLEKAAVWEDAHIVERIMSLGAR